jgi:hypothetical protein
MTDRNRQYAEAMVTPAAGRRVVEPATEPNTGPATGPADPFEDHWRAGRPITSLAEWRAERVARRDARHAADRSRPAG